MSAGIEPSAALDVWPPELPCLRAPSTLGGDVFWIDARLVERLRPPAGSVR